MATTVFSVRMKERTYEKLRTIAGRRKTSINGLMNELAEELVEKEKPMTLKEALGDYIAAFSFGGNGANHDEILGEILEEQRRKGHL